MRGDGAPGIVGVTDIELDAAGRLGLTIKLLATANRAESVVAAGVLPTAVPAGGPFGRTGGVANRIEIEADPVGTVAFSGPGAGSAATSSAVLGDLVAVARGLASTWSGRPAAGRSAEPAGDPLAGERAWFAFVPRAALGRGLTRASPAGAAVTELATGLAIRTEPHTLEGARAAIASILDDGADVTLYPIDD